MGSFDVKEIKSQEEQKHYLQLLLKDIEALDRMLQSEAFETDVVRIGAEQEFCLVNENMEPSIKALDLLAEIDDPNVASELALYNLEVNVDPQILEGKCFTSLLDQLNTLMEKVGKTADKQGVKIVYTGILPTIALRHLEESYMTPYERYKILNRAIFKRRKGDIEIHIQGADEINLHHRTILFEGCNTSFQAHLQIDPHNFADTYNWAQTISAPVLAISANSPLLMGRELWHETRIALFSQSIDTRASSYLLNERESRVSFGHDWAQGTIADYFRNSIVRFRSLLTVGTDEESLQILEQGEAPKLRAMNLHNGTVYRWNRPCYGTTNGKPHIRIENRYMPSGPTRHDEIANMMFWVGLMQGRTKEYENISEKMAFRDVRGNFYHAARYGMASQLYWNGQWRPVKDLVINELLPMAYRGLHRMKVDPADVERFLGIIKKRMDSHNGASWMIESYRNLRKHYKPSMALRKLTAAMYEKQQKGYPVDSWELAKGHEADALVENHLVVDIMSTRVISANEHDPAELVIRMMEWNNIHHLPIVNDNDELVGLLTWTDVLKAEVSPDRMERTLQELMKTEVIIIGPREPLDEASKKMKAHNINCLPVIQNNKLVGIVTSTDLAQ